MSSKTPIQKSDAEWQKELDPLAHHVLRNHGTERPFTSPLNHEKRPGVFRCAGCGEPLFDSQTKYESGSGWPSFYAPMPDAVTTTTDVSHGMTRTEVLCAKCGGHLGHVFPDGPQADRRALLHERRGAQVRGEEVATERGVSGSEFVNVSASCQTPTSRRGTERGGVSRRVSGGWPNHLHALPIEKNSRPLSVRCGRGCVQ